MNCKRCKKLLALLKELYENVEGESGLWDLCLFCYNEHEEGHTDSCIMKKVNDELQI